MGNELATWLSQQVQERGWSLRQTARRAGLSHSTVARLANGEIGWTPDTCTALSKVFGVPLEDVFRLAGILPTNAANSGRLMRERPRIVYEVDTERLLIDRWRALNPDDQALVSALLERLTALAPRIVE